MRSVRLALVALLWVIPVSSSSAAPVTVERKAFAVWHVGSRDAVKIIGVAAWTSRSPESTDEVARFAVFEGLCLDGADDDSCLVSSSGYVSGKAKPGEIEIDQAMGSAHLQVTRRGKTVDVAWEGLDEAEPFAGEVYCSDNEGGALGVLERAATASGTVLGRRLRASSLRSAELTIGARVCPSGPAELAALLSGGDLELHFR